MCCGVWFIRRSNTFIVDVVVTRMQQFVPCLVLMALLGVPATACAQEPALPNHVRELIDEVHKVVDQVRKDEAHGGRATTEAGGLEEGGVIPFTRTLVALLWKGLPILEEDDDGVTHQTPFLIQLKPKSHGGQLRWTVRF